MKRRLYLSFLMLLIVITASCSAKALTGYEAVNMAEGGWVCSPAAAYGGLYFLSNGRVYALNDQGKAPEIVMEKQEITYLISGGDKLYGLSFDEKIYPLLKDGGKLTEGEPIVLELPYNETGSWMDGAADGSFLYLLYGDGNGAGGAESLITYDLASGQQTSASLTGIWEMVLLKDGRLLTLQEDVREWGKSKLLYMNLKTGETEPYVDLPGSQAGGLAYDDALDTVYVCVGSMIYRSAAGKPFESCGIMPVTASTSTEAVLLNSKYAAASESALYLCDTTVDVDSLPKLTIFGSASENAKASFRKAYPGVAILVQPMDYAAKQDIAVSLFTQNTSADIIEVPISAGYFPQMKEKGFFTDLSGSPLLKGEVQKMLPGLTGALWQGGMLCAYPAWAIGANTLCYNKVLWEELGFQGDDLPRTMTEFIDFAVRWMDMYAYDHPDVAPFHALYDARWQLHRWSVYQYTLAFEPKAGEPYFDVPVLQGLLGKLDEAAPALHEMDQFYNASFRGNPDTNPSVLFDFYGNMLEYDYDFAAWRPLLLTFGEGDAPRETMQLNVFVINPYSKNKELAMAFLECAAGTLDANTQALLYADETRLVESQNYPMYVKQHEDNMLMLENALKTAAAEEKKSLEEDLAAEKANFDDIQKSSRWAVPPDMIERYKNLVPFLCVSGMNTLMDDVYSASSTLFERYDDGEINAGQFLKELEHIYRMRNME